MTDTIEMAALGYKQGAREQETRRTPARHSLSRVKGQLHYDYAQLLESPPTKQEARFLSKDMQTLLQDLEYADKGMQAIPGIEQKIKNIESQMYQAMADKNPDKYNNLELSLRNEQKTLKDIQAKVEDSIRAAKAYHENNPGDIAKSRDMLKTLRTELSAPYSYSEAKDNLASHTKPVVQWLDDLKDKSILDDRVLAQNVLKAGNVDYKGILNEVERQGLSLTDQAIAEMREKGKAELP
jgi:DNA repair ATPase RecN